MVVRPHTFRMADDPHLPPAVRWLWLVLGTLAVGLVLLLWWATMRDRTFDPDALRQFPLEALARGRQFSREVRTAGSLQSLASLLMLAVLGFTTAGSGVMRRLERLGRGHFWLSVAIVVLSIGLISAVVELPFAYYLGFLHERAYGMTRLTPGAWFTAHYKSMGLHLGMALLFWLPVYGMIRRWPRRWWVMAALFNLAFTAVMALLGPVLLMPFSNQLVPVRDPQVLAMVQRLSDRAGVKVTKVQEMLVSKKTDRVNAMVTGLGATKQIIVYDTLLKRFPPAEVEVVLAHELSHAVHQDVTRSILLTGALEALAFLLAAWVLRSMVGTGALRIGAPCAPRGIALLMLLLTLAGGVTDPIQSYVSRQMEVRADRFALTLTQNPQAFIAGFRKLAAGNPGDVDPPVLVELLEHTHPSVMNRIRMAARFEAERK